MAADVLARMRAPEPIRLQHGLGTAPTNQQGHRGSWRRCCLGGGSVPPSTPDLAASTRWQDSPGNQPEATDHLGRQGQLPSRGRDRAARVRGHRELCPCMVRQPAIPGWRWHWGDCQNSVGEGMSLGKLSSFQLTHLGWQSRMSVVPRALFSSYCGQER